MVDMAAKKKKPAKQASAQRTKRTRSTPDWSPRFLAALAESACILHACTLAGVSRTNVYQRRDADPEFAAALASALEDATDALELEARRRALHGVDEPVVYQGELMGVWVNARGDIVAEGTAGARQIPLTVKKYSDALMALLLKAHRPERYRDKVDHKHSGVDGGAIEHVVVYVPANAREGDPPPAGAAGELPEKLG